MANTKISALTALTNPTGNEELVYAYNNANGKMTLDTMKTFASADSQATLVSGVNIKTINNTSILGSGNIDVSGGGGGGGFEPTELGGDANIWELSEGAYVTTYNLYYITGETVPAIGSTGTRKQMLFVVEESTGEKGYFVFNEGHRTSGAFGYASYGYSNSSSVGACYQLGQRDWALSHYGVALSGSTTVDALSSSTLTQIITEVSGTQPINISSSSAPYEGVTYTILIDSVASGSTYSITLGTGVTNPFNVTLPSSSNKRCLITLLVTSPTAAIVTGCTIAS